MTHLAHVTGEPEAEGLTSVQGRVDGQCRAVSGPQPLTPTPSSVEPCSSLLSDPQTQGEIS